MEKRKKEAFQVIGIQTKTINAPGKAEQDIPQLWNKFMKELPGNQLPQKISEEIFCVYCEYEGDHTQPYTTLIGYAVPLGTAVPNGMYSLNIPASEYLIYHAEGNLTKDAVINTWKEIWNTKADRSYQADFEVYGKDAMNPEAGKIEIFVSIN